MREARDRFRGLYAASMGESDRESSESVHADPTLLGGEWREGPPPSRRNQKSAAWTFAKSSLAPWPS